VKYVALGLLLVSGLLGAQAPQSKHVWLVAEENHSYEVVMGNPGMPYFNSLAVKYGLATQYYSEQHNSISALMWLVAGQPVTPNNSNTTCFNLDNVARHVIAQGMTWRSYQEDLPSAGYAGVSWLEYVRRHNPIINFTDTCAPSQAINSVPFTQLATDIANRMTPNYAYVTPNLLDDAHDGTLAQADYWLSQNLPAILALPEFQPGGDGLLFVVFDEADLSGTPDNRCTATISQGCGGRLATLVIGPQVKPGYQSTIRYDHASLLRTVCDAMGFASCPGAGAVASPMTDFFNAVTVSNPMPNATVASPVHIQASTSDSSAVTAMQIYVDDVLKYQVAGNVVNTHLLLALGQHLIVVQSWDAGGGIHKRGVDVTVQAEAVVVTSPAPNAVVGPSVSVSASGNGQSPVTKMQLYVDGVPGYVSSGSTLNTSTLLRTGNHKLAVQSTDKLGALTTTTVAVTSASPAVQILAPAQNTSTYSPISISATTQDPTPVTAVQIYVDNQLTYQVSGTGVQAWLQMSPGQHYVVVQAWDAAGATYKSGVTINVSGVPITISSPAANATVNSPVIVAGSAPAASPVQTMQIYVDNALVFASAGQSVNQALTMPPGQHYIVLKGWDLYGDNWYSGEYVTVP
jgi:phosphatidylinositol-3-phosphatase